MFALEISEKTRFFVSCLFGKVLDDFQKKISCHHFSFLQGLYLASSAFKDNTKSLIIVLGLGKNNVAAKKGNWGIRKKRFFRFYAKIAVSTGFQSAALE